MIRLTSIQQALSLRGTIPVLADRYSLSVRKDKLFKFTQHLILSRLD